MEGSFEIDTSDLGKIAGTDLWFAYGMTHLLYTDLLGAQLMDDEIRAIAWSSKPLREYMWSVAMITTRSGASCLQF